MTTLGMHAEGVRAKNAGPFMITIDVFCGSKEVFFAVAEKFPVSRVAKLLDLAASDVRRYELPELDVVKFSFPRTVAQGGALDRDMHGAQFAAVLAECPFDSEEAKGPVGMLSPRMTFSPGICNSRDKFGAAKLMRRKGQ